MNLEISDGRERFYQWDSGQKLVVEDAGLCNEVHFVGSSPENALVCRIQEHLGKPMVDVPNILLQTSGLITAYLFWHDENGAMTSYAKSFVVQKRAKPESYVYEQTQTLNYSALAERIAQLEQADISADAIARGVEQYLSENPVTPESIGALAKDALPGAVETALAQAKAGGEFKGESGEKGEPGPQGLQGEKGETGLAGYTPQRGTDYWTDSDIAQIKSYVDDAILGGAW